MKKVSKNKGFTLIEILVVIGIIAILATIVIIAINPARQFAQARNTQRQANIDSILNAIGQNLADNKGIFCPGTSISGTTSIPVSGGLTTCLVPTYMSAIPSDPAATSTSNTGYEVSYSSGRYTVCAPLANNETILGTPAPSICVTR